MLYFRTKGNGFEIVRLIENGANINYNDEDGKSLLIVAVRHGKKYNLS